MMIRRLIAPALALSVALVACGQDPPPPPGPVEENTQMEPPPETGPDTAEQRRQAELEEQRRLEAARAAAIETLEEMIFFEYDEAAITSAAEQTLRAKLSILRDNPQVEIRIEGHADERGSTEYNVALARERAEAVRDFLVGFGLDPDRFETISYGEEQPLVNQSNESAWARNRRAEFAITAGAQSIQGD